MQTAELDYNRTGQTVEFYPPESAQMAIGVPSSVTYTVRAGSSSDDATAEFSGSATVDSVSTTLAAAAGASQTTRNALTVASSTGITAGRLYLLDSTYSQREVVEPKKINSTAVTLVTDLQNDYPITVSTFKGIRCVFTVDSTWVATESKILGPADPSYRIIWTYTVGGVVYTFQTYLRLVRRSMRSTVNAQDLIDHWPDLLVNEPRDQRGEKFKRIISAAEERVRTDVLVEGYRPEQIHDTEILDRLVRLAAFLQIGEYIKASSGVDRENFIKRRQDEYASLLTRAITNLKIPVTESTEGDTAIAPFRQDFFRR